MSYRQDPYYNNGGYAGGYQQGSNPRMPNDGYRIPNRGPYSTQNPNIIGSAMGTSSGRAADEDDNISLGSSVYSQPSVAGFTPSNNIDNMRYYQEQSLETTEPRRQSLLYNEYSDYPPPPSPFAASTNTHNSGTGLTAGSSQIGLPLIDQNENNYMPENMEGNRYQNTQPQLDVYNDFNNNYQNDEKYDEESRHDTLTGPDGAHDPNSYAMNIDYTDNRDFSGNGKAARQSMTGEHYVVPPKKRRCAFCSRKTCVIITFTTLVFLAAGMFFVWPRIPVVNFSSQPTALGDANITITPAVVNMQMGLQFELDNTENWLPYNFNSFDVNVFDAANLNSNNPIATGNKKGFSIPGRAKSTVSIPTSFYYTASAPTDSLLKSFVTACTQSPDNEQKTTLNFRAEVTMLIKGLDWVKKPEITVQLGELQCPFNIPRPTPGPAPGVDPTQPIAPPTDPAAQPAPGAAPATDPAAQPPAGQPAPGATPATDPVAQPPAGQPAPGAAPATDPVAQPPAAQPAPGAAPATDPVAQPPAAQPAPAAPATDSAAQPPAAQPAPGAAPPTTPATDPAPANGGP